MSLIKSNTDHNVAFWDPTREIYIMASQKHNNYIMIKAEARQCDYPWSAATPPRAKSDFESVWCAPPCHNSVLCFVSRSVLEK